MQREVPGDTLSRVAAFDFIGMTALMPLGYAVMGPLAGRFGTATVLFVAAGFVTTLVAVTTASSDLRRAEP